MTKVGRGRQSIPHEEAMDIERLARQTYLTVPEAVAYLRFPSASALYSWAYRRKMPRCHTGVNGRGTVRFLRRDLDDAMQSR
jgi:hypothetical protein